MKTEYFSAISPNFIFHYYIIILYFLFPLYSDTNNPATVRKVPAAEIHVTGSFKISTEVRMVITGTI